MPQTLWTACRLPAADKAQLLGAFVAGLSARRASAGVCSCPAAERFYHLTRCAAVERVSARHAFGIEALNDHHCFPETIVVGVSLRNGAVRFCPKTVASFAEEKSSFPALREKEFLLSFRIAKAKVQVRAPVCLARESEPPDLLHDFCRYAAQRLSGHCGIDYNRFPFYLAACLLLFLHRSRPALETQQALEALMQSTPFEAAHTTIKLRPICLGRYARLVR